MIGHSTRGRPPSTFPDRYPIRFTGDLWSHSITMTRKNRRGGFSIVESLFMLIVIFTFTWITAAVLKKNKVWPFGSNKASHVEGTRPSVP